MVKHQDVLPLEDANQLVVFNDKTDVIMPWLMNTIASLPMHVARSGVFKPDNPGDSIFNEIVIYEDDELSVSFTGEMMDQDQADVLMVVNDCIKNGLADELGRVKITKAAFLEKINWSLSSHGYKRLLVALKKLTKAVFFYDSVGTSEERKRSLPMRMFQYEQDEKYLLLWIPKESQKMFDSNTLLSWDKRQMIAPRNNLAKFLQVQINSYPETKSKTMLLIDLKKRAEYESPERKFAQALRNAFDELIRVNVIESGWVNKLEDGKWWCGWKAI
jgi:hypothetical protein